MASRVRFSICLIVGVSLLMMAAGSSLGAERDHEDGLFIRLSAGGGYASTETEVDGRSVTMKMDGPAAEFNFAIGGMVRPNLALHGTIFGWYMHQPDLAVGSQSGTLQADLNLGALGGGATYYFMPANAYISASFGFGPLSIEADDVTVESDFGPVFDVTIGKEWWVGDEWGLGVAGGFSYHSIPDDSAEENWTGMSYAIRFSATKN